MLFKKIYSSKFGHARFHTEVLENENKDTVLWLGFLTFPPKYELPHGKTNKMIHAPSKDSDQPGLSPSLIGVFTVRMKIRKIGSLATH